MNRKILLRSAIVIYALTTVTLTCPLWLHFKCGHLMNVIGLCLAGIAFVVIMLWLICDWILEK